MSAYAALVSLRQNLGTLRFPLPRITLGRARLLSLYEEVTHLLDFLDDSSTRETSQISALETKMRDAAYKAEDLIEYVILDLKRKGSPHSWKILFYSILSTLILGSINVGVYVRLAEVRSYFFMFSINIVGLGLLLPEIYVFTSPSYIRELRGVLYDFNMIVEEVVQIKSARGDPDMSARAALVSLRQILDPVLHSGRKTRNSNHLESLQQNVTLLLDFLGDASPYMTTHELELRNLDAAISNAAYKAKKALFCFPAVGDASPYITTQLRYLDAEIGKAIQALFPGRNFRWAENTLTNFSAHGMILILYPVLAIMIFTLLTCLITYSGFAQEMIQLQILIIFACFMIMSAVAYVFLVLLLPAEFNSKNPELLQVVDDFSVLVKCVRQIEEVFGNPSELLPAAASASSRQDLGGTSRNVIVGLDSDFEEIKARLVQDSKKRELTSIVGMGGIGKTTLARQVYYDPSISDRFDIRAWVTVSQEYSLRHVLLFLLESAGMLKQELQEDNDDKLALQLHRTLMGRRYLIVMDDVWDTEIWDFMSNYFPEDCNGSRVLLTSRLSNVASYPDSSSRLHQMQCLNEDNSWDLLREKVFGAQTFPPELEIIGREIAISCRGLPLSIVVIGGLLYNDNRIQSWRDIAEKLQNSQMRQINEQCLEILGLSYNHLPHHLRPCFLYMGVFMRDREIPISRLISLWAAEGFLKHCASKNLEELAVDYLKDLNDRNLISVCKRSCNGKMRTCSIHDLLRDVCVQNAYKENFLHVVYSEGYPTRTRPDETPRRLSIHLDALQPNATLNLKVCGNYVRSLHCSGSKPIKDSSVVYLGFMYLRVLDVLAVHFGMFPRRIIKLRHLRYLALHSDGPLPPSISNLWNLQTLVYHHCSFCNYPLLPPVIWSMPNLRHLYVKPDCYLSNPIGHRLPRNSFVLEHLQTLVGIRNFKWTEGIIRIPNLKKLGISYDVSSSVDWSAYQLESLVDLHQLESLKIIIKYNDEGSAISHDPPKLAFPQELKKLSLSGCGIPWASMTSIGALQNLEALKLRCEAFSGESWETVEGEFPQLVFLLLEEMSFRRWESEAEHFPRLQRLVIKSCGALEEIPPAVGDIPTLEMIHLVDCHPSAVDSAKQIQQEQEDYGNEVLKVRIEPRGVREVDEMNLGDMEARGVGGGVFGRGLQVVTDVVDSIGDEVMFRADYWACWDDPGIRKFLILVCKYLLRISFPTFLNEFVLNSCFGLVLLCMTWSSWMST